MILNERFVSTECVPLPVNDRFASTECLVMLVNEPQKERFMEAPDSLKNEGEKFQPCSLVAARIPFPYLIHTQKLRFFTDIMLSSDSQPAFCLDRMRTSDSKGAFRLYSMLSFGFFSGHSRKLEKSS